MIENLNDLKNYTDARARRTPGIAAHVELHEPGIGADALSRLSALNLPPVYERCLRTFNLFGISLGYFSLWPDSIRSGNMSEALLQAAAGNFRGAHEATHAGLLIVAQEESNLVCVARSNDIKPDTVTLLDVMRSPTVERHCIATDFEKFLLLAGNLNDIGLRYEEDASQGMDQMDQCCRYFGCTTEQSAYWLSKAEELLL